MDTAAKATEAELIDRGAAGDIAALREMADRCLLNGAKLLTAFEAIAYAEIFARLAAAKGDAADRLKLAAVLRIRSYHVDEIGDRERAANLLTASERLCGDLRGVSLTGGVEFLAGVLTSAADQGDDRASVALERLTAALSAADADSLRHTLNRAVRHLEELDEEVHG